MVEWPWLRQKQFGQRERRYGIQRFRLYSESRRPESSLLPPIKCAACGFSILVRSIEELVEHEKLHRTQCNPSNVAA